MGAVVNEEEGCKGWHLLEHMWRLLYMLVSIVESKHYQEKIVRKKDKSIALLNLKFKNGSKML